ncbi:MAG: hypothetical protein ACJ78Q_09860 [Chloroflexia bacterium]
MCGGVIFPYKKEYREALEKYYPPEQIEEFERTGQVRSLYWQKSNPVLPVVPKADDGQPSTPDILAWGNRDKDTPFPQTGWARKDSLDAGKWDYLRPEPVVIPVTHGVEKGKWFEIKNGIEGIVLHRGDENRVYMITDNADPEYLEVTHHERMPALIDQPDIPWLPSDPALQA